MRVSSHYNVGLLGRSDATTVKAFIKSCMTMHQVIVPEEGKPVCDCKAFWRGYLCSHVVAMRGILGTYDVQKLGKQLAVNQKRGRKRNNPPALIRVEDAKKCNPKAKAKASEGKVVAGKGKTTKGKKDKRK